MNELQELSNQQEQVLFHLEELEKKITMVLNEYLGKSTVITEKEEKKEEKEPEFCTWEKETENGHNGQIF